jgi:Ulp1 family protease
LANILSEASHLSIEFPNERSARRYASLDGKISFEKDDVARIAPGQFLNAGCIAALLKVMREKHDSEGRFAIFNTYALEVVKSHDDISGKEYIKRLSYSGFRVRSEWIIPIHCDFHWTMMVVNCAKRELWHFDSLARKSEWQRDVTVSWL